MNGLAICSGVGGLELGIELALGEQFRCICHIERDAYAAANIVARMADKALAPAPIWDDIFTFDRGAARWISSLPDSPASPSVSPASSEPKKTSATSSPESRTSFATWDRDSSSWKTCEGCLPLAGVESLGTYSERWPTSGSIRSGSASEQAPWEPPTDASGFSFWRTPAASEVGPRLETLSTADGGPLQVGRRVYRKTPTGKLVNQTVTLGLQAEKTWPTPFGFDHGNGPDGNEFSTAVRKTVATWPTPRASDGGNENSHNRTFSGTDFNLHNAVLGRGRIPKSFPSEGMPWCHSPPDPKTETPGLESSQSDPTSPPRWPTPTSRDYKDGACADQDVPTNALLGRSAARWGADAPKAKLNPNFVDWMMGWPVGWTSAKTGLDAREMASWRSKQRQLLAYLLGGQG